MTKISVIIPTYNEKKVLEKAIESLGEQTYSDFEIIIVDDGSTDGTLEILENLSKTLKDFSFYRQKHLGAGAARNLGASKAKGDILVFVDADMTFDPDFLKYLVKPIMEDKDHPYGTFSAEEYVSNWENVWARCWNINEGWEEKRRHPKDYPEHQYVFRAILKSEFDRVGGFTPGGYNDDWSLHEKLHYQAIIAPHAVFYHKNPSSLEEIYNHAKWIGKRKYKAGFAGYLIALFRSSLPVSLIIGLYKGLLSKEMRFLVFKVVYDFGIFIGVLNYIIFGTGAK